MPLTKTVIVAMVLSIISTSYKNEAVPEPAEGLAVFGTCKAVYGNDILSESISLVALTYITGVGRYKTHK